MKEQFLSLINEELKQSPFSEIEIEHQASSDLMRFDVEVDNIVIGKRVNYFEKKWAQRWPIEVRIEYDETQAEENFDENLINIIQKINAVMNQRSWVIQKELEPLQDEILKMLSTYTLKSFIMTRNNELLGKDQKEYYISLSYFKWKILNDKLFNFYCLHLFNFFKKFQEALMESTLPLFIASNRSGDLSRNISAPMPAKIGSQFFGTDPKTIDFSLSAHKAMFTKAQDKAKSTDRYCSISGSPSDLSFWINRYTMRPTYRYWQEIIEYDVDLFWLD